MVSRASGSQHCPACRSELCRSRASQGSRRRRPASSPSAGSLIVARSTSREVTGRRTALKLRRCNHRCRRGGAGRTGTRRSTSSPSASAARRCSSSSWRWPPSSPTSPRYNAIPGRSLVQYAILFSFHTRN